MVKLNDENTFIKGAWDDAYQNIMTGGTRPLRTPPLWPKRNKYMKLFWEAYRDIISRLWAGEKPQDIYWDWWHAVPNDFPEPTTSSSGNCDFQVITL